MKELPMAKSKTKVPKTVAGVKVPKALRKSGWLDPMLAGAAMALSSVSVIGNALRLRTVRL